MASQADLFVLDLLDCARDHPIVRLRILAKLAAWGGQTVYLPVESAAEARKATAKKMLAGGMSNAEAVEALRKRFGCSRRTAERTIKAVRNLENMSSGDDVSS